ncbi:MAG TPA: carbohydrate kinase family protein [Archaeoglobaceae archaeon]|nr:carbohydrate kinase family protein [Archaeoglobaceae archaeon]
MIAGVGPALVDHIHLIDRYPSKGEMSTVRKSFKMAGGAVTNVLYGLSKFGVKSRLYSTIGEDEDAKFFINVMKEVGVELRLKVTCSETGRVDVYVDSDGERTFFVHPNAAGKIEMEMNSSDFQEVDYFYFDPFPSERSLNFHLGIAEKAKEHEKIVILNPGMPYTSDPEGLLNLLKYTDLVFISEKEYNLLGINEDDFLKFVKLLVVTMGEKGSIAVSKEIKVEERAFRVNAVDTTGAGDAFAAGFLFAYFRSSPLNICLKTGNYVASVNIQHYGGKNFPERSEIERFIEKN